MDRECHIRSRVDLNHILENHLLWLKKYKVSVGGTASLLADEALSSPLRADLSKAQLTAADLTNADLTNADLTGAVLTGAVLISTNFHGASLLGADLSGTHLMGTNFSASDLTNASLARDDLSCSRQGGGNQSCVNFEYADLSGADLTSANLAGADLGDREFAGAHLDQANLTGANLRDTDLSNTSLVQADLTSAILQRTDFTGADVTLAKFWYSDFEPKATPLLATMSPGEGLETVRWAVDPVSDGFNNELDYRLRVEQAQQSNGRRMPTVPKIRDRWLVWLSCYRDRLDNKKYGLVGSRVEDAIYFVSDVFLGLHPSVPNECPSRPSKETGRPYENLQATRSHKDLPARRAAETLAEYQLVDVRTAALGASHPEIALETNLALQRHKESAIEMIVYDWTCAYGAAPARPIRFVFALAVLALPFYWVGFRRQRHGVKLFRVDEHGEKEEEIPSGGFRNKPRWQSRLGFKRSPGSTWRLWLLTSLHLTRPTHDMRLFLASRMPRVRWEVTFAKAVVLFSLISVIDLGFEGFDFGRWVRMLFFTKYDLKARGWLRAVSGLQSIIGLGLLALSVLSFFGHLFE
jgi:uncharacterized protein YjbI with pentapeptide repeats